MLIDHFACVFLPYAPMYTAEGKLNFSPYLIGRGIGRIAFPIFCFLLVEGFYYTKSRRKYMVRLAVFALLSEFPFDACFQMPLREMAGADSALIWERMLSYQSVMLTLLAGFLLMYGYEHVKTKYMTQPLIFNTLGALLIIGTSMVTELLRTDYSYVGVLFILIFYLFRGHKNWIFIGILLVIFLFANEAEMPALAALLPIFAYNGKSGRKLKYVFYAFYPVHLMLLALIKYCMA